MRSVKGVRYFSKDEDDNVPKKKKSKKRKLKSSIKTTGKNKSFRKETLNEETSPSVTTDKIVHKSTIPANVLNKYSKGSTMNINNIKTVRHQKRFEAKEKIYEFATEQAAKNEILLPENSGYLEADSGETTTEFTQSRLVDSLDITTATKHFDLKLMEFGPYRIKYTRNGRHLLGGGKRGHVFAIDWITKNLHCETNVMESVHDVCWLHLETMFAVAQKDWVYIYDNQGIELHCVKRLNKVARMEFLPYHFLLGCCSEEGYLSWLDISRGEIVNQFNSRLGRLSMMTQNPYNALLCIGHAKGVVSMWAPSSRDPLAKMLCHKAPLSALHIDPRGLYMATAATNREVKIWDIRKLNGPLQEYKLRSAATNIELSQKNVMALGMGNVVELYRDCCTQPARRTYMRHRFNWPISNFHFCPYEDVLGVATDKGFTSLIIPGSGEPNFDALETNPFQSKKQRREREVKSLLEKIQPELISLNPLDINEVNVPRVLDIIEEKKKLLFVKPKKIDFKPRNKGLGSAKLFKRKKIAKEESRKEFVKNATQKDPGEQSTSNINISKTLKQKPEELGLNTFFK